MTRQKITEDINLDLVILALLYMFFIYALTFLLTFDVHKSSSQIGGAGGSRTPIRH